MSKPTGISHSTLSWVKKELDETLRQAAEALEAYSQDPSDPTQLQFCGSHLHQVHGILQMLELFGAAMLAEEMGHVVEALLERRVQQAGEAQQTLMQAILQLGDYLERVQSGLQDIPILLLPLLNDLRAGRGATLLTEHSLFTPNLDAGAQRPDRPTADGETLQDAARRLRSRYQRALLGVLRGQNVPESLAQMLDVLSQLDAADEGESGNLWWIAAGLVEALQENAVEGAAAVKTLLGQLDRQLRRVIEAGPAALASESPRELIKNLLYYVARAEPRGERVPAIQAHYRLKELLVDEQQLDSARQGLAGPNTDILQSVASALMEDLATAKDAIDLFARSGYADHGRLLPLQDNLNRIADTLGVLGLGVPRRVVKDQVVRIKALTTGEAAADEAQLMAIAEALLYVESAIEGLAVSRAVEEPEPEEAAGQPPLRQLSESEYQQVYGAALHEVIADVGQIKEAIVKFLETGSADELADIQCRLASLTGALKMLDKAHVAELLDATSAYVAARLIPGGRLPGAAELDGLADAIAAVEYYLEAARDGRPHPESVLEMATSALGRLGFPPGAGPAPSAEETDDNEPAAETAVAPAEPPAAAPAKKSGRINYDVPIMSDTIDGDILEIFIEEAGEVLETLRVEFPRWHSDPDNNEALITLRRMYHTLKGSGRLAGALLLGELAWSIENLLNRVLDKSITAGPAVFEVVEQTIQILPGMIGQIQGDPAPEVDVLAIMRRAEALANPNQPNESAGASNGQDPAPLPTPEVVELPAAEPVETEPEALPAVDEVIEAAPAPEAEAIVLESLDAEPEPPVVEHIELQPLTLPDDQAPDAAPPPVEGLELELLEGPGEQLPAASDAVTEEEPAAAAAPAMDPVLYDIFSRETADHLSVVANFIARGRNLAGQAQPNEALVRALHTLTGSARMADVAPIAEVGRRLEILAERHLAAEQPFGMSGLDLLERGAAVIEEMVAGLAGPTPVWPDNGPLIAEIDAAAAALEHLIPQPTMPPESVLEPEPEPEEEVRPAAADTDVDTDLVALFLEEAEDILQSLEGAVQRWEGEPDHTSTVAELHRLLHTLKGGARLAGFNGIGTLCHMLEGIAAEVDAEKVPADAAFFGVLRDGLDRLTDMIADARRGISPEAPADLLRAIANLHGAAPQGSVPSADYAGTDLELVEVFLEEAADLLETLEAGIANWQAEPSNAEFNAELQRTLHTLKGGARMAGFLVMADLSHALETLLVAVQEGVAAPSEALFQLLEQAYDRLYQLRGQAGDGQPMAPAEDLLATIAELREHTEADGPEPDAPLDATPTAESAPEPEEQRPLPAVREAAAAVDATAEPALAGRQDPAGQGDVVRVRAELLDNLVNFAGEVSIYRARLEQQVGAMRFNLGELEQTVARLREQLRTLEIETEAQILYRFEREYEDAQAGREDFDPLELDRFSRMQELSRALSESTNDLVSIQGLLDNLIRESETLLLQQSRVNTELQDGLMRTRMVPFANLVPRMRRIVRQTCQELGKQAQLKVLGAQGEMDRTVLERVTAPLEHMLRNAVAHGIEDPQVRQEAGKPAEGTISVSLAREGADVVIRVSDDGGGIKLDAVRRKAIAQGLMPADASLSDREVMQFILEAGFSTADAVTQIAGRGVGLDVVASEIKQLGGTLEIDSNASAGTTFTIRLPFTLAVNQALLCQVGEDVYAIPLTSIVGVVRMGHEELQDCYASPHATYYDYAGERYEVRALSSLLATGEPQLPGHGDQAPIILVQAGDYRLAIHVDALLGNREIVVKSAGAQLSTVPGIYGATILADGRVVLILDISSLVRAALTASAAVEPSLPAAVSVADPERKTTIMVVDDSITMRKVAARLLERNGMAVLTAKDGVDAVAQLQENVPDAMLLDIEMPRMDGYELATYMRNDERLRTVPIIMITSRTGEKHRQRALEIGVNRYLGKPYQEADLLENLHAVLEEAGVGS